MSHSDGWTRRVEYAFGTIAPSLLSAAISTLLACFFLFFTTITFFTKFGIFLFATILVTLVVTLITIPSFVFVVVDLSNWFSRRRSAAVDGDAAPPPGRGGTRRRSRSSGRSSSRTRGTELGRRHRRSHRPHQQHQQAGSGDELSVKETESVDVNADSEGSTPTGCCVAAVLIWIALILLVVVSSVLSAVGQPQRDQTDTGDAAVANASGSDSAPFVLSAGMTALSLDNGGWWELSPKGAVCGKGSPYRFYFRRKRRAGEGGGGGGAGQHIIVEFEGGGACWSQRTCAAASATFKQSAESTRRYFWSGVANSGIREARVWQHFSAHLYVTYCTADLHWGNSTVKYDEDSPPILHRGAVNAAAALEFLYAQWADSPPETVLVTGCSAGSYASLMHALHIAHHWPTATVRQLGDAGVGVVTDSFLRDSFSSWNAAPLLPGWLFEADARAQNMTAAALLSHQLDLGTLSLLDLYWRAATAAAGTQNGNAFSQWTSMFDWNQAFFYSVMQNDDSETTERDDFVSPKARRQWSERMLAIFAQLQDLPRFRSVIWPGDDHCFIPYQRLRTIGSLQSAWAAVANSSAPRGGGGGEFVSSSPPAIRWLLDYAFNHRLPESLSCQNQFSCQLHVDFRER